MKFVWDRCNGRETVGNILDGLRQGFEGAEDSGLETDLGRAVEDLVGLGLVVDSASPGA